MQKKQRVRYGPEGIAKIVSDDGCHLAHHSQPFAFHQSIAQEGGDAEGHDQRHGRDEPTGHGLGCAGHDDHEARGSHGQEDVERRPTSGEPEWGCEADPDEERAQQSGMGVQFGEEESEVDENQASENGQVPGVARWVVPYPVEDQRGGKDEAQENRHPGAVANVERVDDPGDDHGQTTERIRESEELTLPVEIEDGFSQAPGRAQNRPTGGPRGATVQPSRQETAPTGTPRSARFRPVHRLESPRRIRTPISSGSQRIGTAW